MRADGSSPAEPGPARDASRAVPFCPGCLAVASPDEASCPRCTLARPAAGWPPDPYLGRVVRGKYRLDARLGAGGFGMVFRARQLLGEIDLGEVVLKFLHRELAGDERLRRRFLNEAWAARRVACPHVVKVFDLDFDDEGLPFMVLEHIEGQSLAAELAVASTLPPARVLRIGAQVATALEACHAVGVIHRDLKPDNLILLGERGGDVVKVIDLGIARVPRADGTLSQHFLGTPRYMAPEQILQGEVDGGADIFALGVILYECLTGAPPIAARTQLEYLQLNVSVAPVPLRERDPALPELVERLVGSMIAKRRADRPASMADVAARLRAVAAACGWTERGPGVADATADLAASSVLPLPLPPSAAGAWRRGACWGAFVACALAALTGWALFRRADRDGPAAPSATTRVREPAPTASSRPVIVAEPVPVPIAAAMPTSASAPTSRATTPAKERFAGRRRLAVTRSAARPVAPARPAPPGPKLDWGDVSGGL